MPEDTLPRRAKRGSRSAKRQGSSHPLVWKTTRDAYANTIHAAWSAVRDETTDDAFAHRIRPVAWRDALWFEIVSSEELLHDHQFYASVDEAKAACQEFEDDLLTGLEG
jgi:hypothetical protein